MKRVIAGLKTCRRQLLQTVATLAEESNQTAEAASRDVGPRLPAPPPQFGKDIATQFRRPSAGMLMVVHCPEQLLGECRLWGGTSGPTVVVALARPPTGITTTTPDPDPKTTPPIAVQAWLGRSSCALVRWLHEY